MVAGEGRKHPVLFVQPNFAYLEDWCGLHDIAWTNASDIMKDQRIIDRIWKEIDGANANFGSWERVKKVYLCDSLWTVEDGQLTPTMKLRRKPILAMYADGFEAMYA
jgi:long-chain acyl-CoA synthetase